MFAERTFSEKNRFRWCGTKVILPSCVTKHNECLKITDVIERARENNASPISKCARSTQIIHLGEDKIELIYFGQ